MTNGANNPFVSEAFLETCPRMHKQLSNRLCWVKPNNLSSHGRALRASKCYLYVSSKNFARAALRRYFFVACVLSAEKPGQGYGGRDTRAATGRERASLQKEKKEVRVYCYVDAKKIL